jgi:hypothetical protein
VKKILFTFALLLITTELKASPIDNNFESKYSQQIKITKTKLYKSSLQGCESIEKAIEKGNTSIIANIKDSSAQRLQNIIWLVAITEKSDLEFGCGGAVGQNALHLQSLFQKGAISEYLSGKNPFIFRKNLDGTPSKSQLEIKP